MKQKRLFELLVFLLCSVAATASGGETFELVTDADQLREGDEVTFVSEEYGVAVKDFDSKYGRLSQTAVTISDGRMELHGSLLKFTLKHRGKHWLFVFPDGEWLSAGSSNNKLLADHDPDYACATISISEGKAEIHFKQGDTPYLRYSHRYGYFKCYDPDRQDDVQIYRRISANTPRSEAFDFGKQTGYFTYVTSRAIDFKQTLTRQPDLMAFKVVQFTPTACALVLLGLGTELSEAVVPEGTPVLLYSDVEGKKNLVVSEEEGTVGGNLLRPSVDGAVKATAEDDFYLLQYNAGEPDWWHLKAGGTVGAAGSRKAYLDGKDMQEALTPPYDRPDMERGIYHFARTPQGTTGIESVKAHNRRTLQIYDLQGRRLKTIPGKGIYIIDGRKQSLPNPLRE